MFLQKLLIKIYEIIFRERVTPAIKIFFDNFQSLVFGYGISAVLLLLFQVLAGRILGPEEYGKYALVDSIATFLYLLMTLGISMALVRYTAQTKDYLTSKKIISTSYLVVAVFLIIITVLFFVFAGPLSKTIKVSLTVFYLSIIFAVCYALYMLATDTLRGLHKMKSLSLIRALFGFFVVLLLSLFLLKNSISFITVILIACFSYLAVFVLVLINIAKYLSFQIDKNWLKKVLEYGLYATGGSFLFFLLPPLSKLMINKFLTVSEVGIYNAYYFSSLNLMMFASTIFVAVFFPTASQYVSKVKILRIIRKSTLP